MTCQNNKKESSSFTSIAKQMENGLRRKKAVQTKLQK